MAAGRNGLSSSLVGQPSNADSARRELTTQWPTSTIQWNPHRHGHQLPKRGQQEEHNTQAPRDKLKSGKPGIPVQTAQYQTAQPPNEPALLTTQGTQPAAHSITLTIKQSHFNLQLGIPFSVIAVQATRLGNQPQGLHRADITLWATPASRNLQEDRDVVEDCNLLKASTH